MEPLNKEQPFCHLYRRAVASKLRGGGGMMANKGLLYVQFKTVARGA